MTIILGIKLSNRLDVAIEFQKIITKYGCTINTRLGLHETNKKYCSTSGIIILEIIDDNKVTELEQELLQIEKIEIQRMIFN